MPASFITGSPVLVSATIIEGFKSEPCFAERQSVTIFWLIPVASSVTSRTEMPETRSTSLAIPPLSAMIGNVYGSHSYNLSPRATLSPDLTNTLVP